MDHCPSLPPRRTIRRWPLGKTMKGRSNDIQPNIGGCTEGTRMDVRGHSLRAWRMMDRGGSEKEKGRDIFAFKCSFVPVSRHRLWVQGI